MPALSESELGQLRNSLSAFSEDAMRYAIEQARDPDKAAQLIHRLREELSSDKVTFTGVALCVTLGEAGAQTAIPILLEAATDERETALQEAATYALQRMGPAAMTAAMTLIESAREPSVRVLAYAILDAAMDCDDETKSRVTNFCLTRAFVEVKTEWPSEDWNPTMAVCSTLLALGETRVRPIIEQQLRTTADPSERDTWKQMLEDLVEGCPRDYDVDWRTDWAPQCEEWATTVDWDDEDFGDEAVDEERAYSLAEELADEFETSRFAQAVEDTPPADVAADILEFLRHGWDYTGLDPGHLSLEALEETLYEWMPRKVSAEAEYFERVPLVLAAFFRFLYATGRLSQPEPFLALADEARTELPRLAADPNNWGMAKSMFMAGTAAGFDMTTEQGMLAFQAAYNASLLSRLEPDEEEDAFDYPDVTAPVRRTEPKIGRNDPCPCGSGKKYKKCCGR